MAKLAKKKKQSSANNIASEGKLNTSQKSSTQFAFLAGAISLAATLISLVVIYVGFIQQGNNSYQKSIANEQLQQYQSLTNSYMAQLSQQLSAIGSLPDVAEKAQQQDHAGLNELVNNLSKIIPGGIQLNYRIKGSSDLSNNGSLPLNFAARDLANKAEASQEVFPEFHQVQNRPVIFHAAAIRRGSQVLGSLVAAVEKGTLENALLKDKQAPKGQIKLVQSFRGIATEITNFGKATSDDPFTLSTANPLWKLEFRPGDEVSDNAPNSLLVLIVAALISIVGIIVATIVVQKQQSTAEQADTGTLLDYIEALLKRPNTPDAAYKLELFSNLAISLKDLLKSNISKAKPEESAQVTTEVAAESNEQSQDKEELADFDFTNPLFQHGTLDIEMIDEEQMDEKVSSDSAETEVPVSIFRAYDIRGVVGETLSIETAELIGKAIGSEALAANEQCVMVGADGRLSSPDISEQLIKGILSTGANVIDVGMVPTPLVYFATNILDDSNTGVMVTGSHNPPNYNGFKIVIGGKTLANEEIQNLYQRIVSNDFNSGQGQRQAIDIVESYIERVRDDIGIAKPLKVVVDCGNGVAGEIAPRLLEELGCEVTPLYCEVDGNFPNHHPDPGKPENLEDLITMVKETGADLGLAFDGDGDRVGVVTETGKVIYPDRLMMLFAKDVVSRNPGADVIFDVKCTRKLTSLISGYGGRPIMWKTGHSLIKAKMKETGALLAGEMSGHIFFKERWYGFDDGIYSAARLLEIISTDNRSVDAIFSAFPEGVSTPEINIEVTDESKFEIVKKLAEEGNFGKGTITDIDGVRVDFQSGWGLVRASNTTPMLVLRFEADTNELLKKIQSLFKKQLLAVAPEISIPF
ncbi:phosphomannomutase/phosphoglucomutase [Spartinivicinus ruber]|uniref:phosphomannomutase/phosphoglucomutase n=1 Tax=Spartinivicinus ruber TaxID=2683272 RepID=UPI0013D11137|nr:phosphomannomutase/phosphoglucomutase [Spartinivicinus ruber]